MDVQTAFRIQIFSSEMRQLNCAESLQGSYCCQDVRASAEYWAILGFALSANGVELEQAVGPDDAASIVIHE